MLLKEEVSIDAGQMRIVFFYFRAGFEGRNCLRLTGQFSLQKNGGFKVAALGRGGNRQADAGGRKSHQPASFHQ
ncbi:MAG: hypothetical protein ABI479_10805 [Gallionella sp.]